MEVILTPEQLKQKAVAVVEKMLADARHYCRGHKCRGCGSDKIKPVAVHEDLNPLFPTKVVIFCRSCGYNREVFADAVKQRDSSYHKELAAAGFKEAPSDLGEKLIIKSKE
jgi:hypothetical protein